MLNIPKTHQVVTIITLLINIHGYSTFKITGGTILNLNHEYFKSYKNLTEVKKLEIISCDIRNITPDAFKDFTNLESLKITNIKNNNVNFNFSIKSLKYLELSKCFLKTPPNLSNFPNLINLNLNNNFIKTINYQQHNLLRSLDLSENLNLEGVNISLNQLTDIKIKNTKLTNVEFYLNCPNLTTLDISQIEIQTDIYKNICNNNNASIYINFPGSVNTIECTPVNYSDEVVGVSKEILDFNILPREEKPKKNSNSIKPSMILKPTRDDNSVETILMNRRTFLGISVATTLLILLLVIIAGIVLTICVLLKTRNRSNYFSYRHLNIENNDYSVYSSSLPLGIFF